MTLQTRQMKSQMSQDDGYIIMHTDGSHVPIRMASNRIEQLWLVWVGVEIERKRKRWSGFVKMVMDKSEDYSIASTPRKAAYALAEKLGGQLYKRDEGKSIMVSVKDGQ